MANGSGKYLNLRTGVTTGVVALFMGLLAWAVAWGPIDVRGLTPGQRQAALERQMHSLLPPAAEMWYAEFYECAPVAMHPDCAYSTVGFDDVEGTDTAGLIIRAATRNGWKLAEDHTDRQGFQFFTFTREGFTAWIVLEDAELTEPCPAVRLASTCMAYVDIQKHAIRWP